MIRKFRIAYKDSITNKPSFDHSRPRNIVADAAYLALSNRRLLRRRGHRLCDPEGSPSQAARPVRQSGLPAAQSGGTPLCRDPTVPTDGHPLRQTRSSLLGDRDAGSDGDLTAGAGLDFADRP